MHSCRGPVLYFSNKGLGWLNSMVVKVSGDYRRARTFESLRHWHSPHMHVPLSVLVHWIPDGPRLCVCVCVCVCGGGGGGGGDNI